MHITVRIRYLVLAAVTLAAIAGGAFAYVEYSLEHIEIDVSGLAVFLNKVIATAQIATLTIPRCESTTDHLPAGDQRQEAMMLYVATVVDLYKTTFGKLPDSIDDLDKLPSFDNAEKLNGRKAKSSCSIHVHPTRSYVLVCGGSLPPAKEIDPFLEKAGHVQRFYMLGGIETLYVPGTGCP